MVGLGTYYENKPMAKCWKASDLCPQSGLWEAYFSEATLWLGLLSPGINEG